MSGVPTHTYGSTEDKQDALDYSVSNSSTVYFTADLSEMYNATTVGLHLSCSSCDRLLTLTNHSSQSAKRGIRYLNGRRQVLLRDEIDTSGTIQWCVPRYMRVS